MRISDLRERVRIDLLEFAWSQWAQIGLAGEVTRTDGWAMDPEALLLFTLEIARRDPRLFDEVLDWLAEKGDAYWAANYTPVDLDVNATFVAFQKIVAGEMDAKQAAQLYQETIEKFREANPPVIENFQSWLD